MYTPCIPNPNYPNGQFEFISCEMGLHVPQRIHSQLQTKSDVGELRAISESSIKNCASIKELIVRRKCLFRSCAFMCKNTVRPKCLRIYRVFAMIFNRHPEWSVIMLVKILPLFHFRYGVSFKEPFSLRNGRNQYEKSAHWRCRWIGALS
jgi:hypothetical protein